MSFDVVECKSFNAMTVFWQSRWVSSFRGTPGTHMSWYAYGQGCGILESSDGYMHDAVAGSSHHCT